MSDSKQIVEVLLKISDSIDKGVGGIIASIDYGSFVLEDFVEYLKERDGIDIRDTEIQRGKAAKSLAFRDAEMNDRLDALISALLLLFGRLVEDRESKNGELAVKK